MPASASRTKIAMSQRAIESSARLTLKNSIGSPIRRFLRMPAVSMRTYCCGRPSVSTANGTSTESRVVPGMGLTMTRSDCVSALMSDDLPTLGRPTMASFNGWSVASCWLSVASARRTSATDSGLPASGPVGGRRSTAVFIKASMPRS